jgi:hypothetical protein
MQDIYIYSDESGGFDYKHCSKYVFAGLIYKDRQTMELDSRKFLSLERKLRNKTKYKALPELKAFKLEEHDRTMLYMVFRDALKFAVVININKLDSKEIFRTAKTKRMYLDFAFSFGIKSVIERLVARGSIFGEEETVLHFLADEHPTATGDQQTLVARLTRVLKEDSSKFLHPLLPNLKDIKIKLCNSETTTLVRGADIIANRVNSNFTVQMLEDFISIAFLP